MRKSTSRKKSSKTFLGNYDNRPRSGLGLHSTRNRHASNFGTLTSDLLKSENREPKLRIARPPQNLISVSNHHWKQITHKLSNKSSLRDNKFSKQNTMKEDSNKEVPSFIDKVGDWNASTPHEISGN